MGSEYQRRIKKQQKSPSQNTVKRSHVTNRNINSIPLRAFENSPTTDNRTQVLRQSSIIEKLGNLRQAYQTAQMKPMIDRSADQVKQRESASIHHLTPTQKQFSLENMEILQRKENRTGLPDNLKNGLENLSGLSMNHVRVHYNSPRPAQLNAHAYTQGGDIHVAPGQERHLPHEGWHVVQQAQGRVRPTMQAKGVQVNDDRSLEREADVMGARAASAVRVKNKENPDLTFVDNHPRLFARQQMQLSAGKSVHTKPLVLQKMQDAGEDPVIEIKGPAVNNPGIRITGLNNCVGVIVRVYGPAMDYIAIAGGHFVTPEMFDFTVPGFTAAGREFIAAIRALVQDYNADDLEWVYHANTEDGRGLNSSKEALQVAAALKALIGAGDIREGGGSITENI